MDSSTPKTILVADGGATSVKWAHILSNRINNIKTSGVNPFNQEPDFIKGLFILELLPKIPNPDDVVQIFYYGAGCCTPPNGDILTQILSSLFPKAEIHVDGDIAAAARATCQKEKGIACILGTGSSLALYDGERVVEDRSGIGYVLGDEGSGAYLGKELVRNYLYGFLNQDLKREFVAKYNLGRSEIVNEVYKKPMANKYLASFSYFLVENRGDKDVEKIIYDGIKDFFEFHILQFDEAKTQKLHFVGSIAYHFKDVLEILCKEYGLELGKVLQSALEGLVAYHSSGRC